MADAEYLYLSPPEVSDRDRRALLAAFDSGWIAPLGPQVEAFEQRFANYLGVPAAAALCSGTAALHLALRVLDVHQGDEVLVSDLTFIATANAVRYVGAQPIFLDSEAASWNLDPVRLEQALTHARARKKMPKALIVVDLYGQCPNFKAIREICDAYKIPIVEDAAEALGARYRGRPAGTLGDLAAFSFNGNKIITTSGGGMLVARESRYVERARWLASQARAPAPHYEHPTVGYNYRLSNLLAGLGLSQLEDLDRRVAARRRIFRRYRDELQDEPGLNWMPEPIGSQSSRWLTTLTIDPRLFGAERDEVISSLAARGIESRPVWKPMHLQAPYRHCRRYGGKVAEQLFRHGLCLPSGSGLTPAQQARVMTAIRASTTHEEGQCIAS